jgi:hypothetical protein
LEFVNTPMTEAEVAAIRLSLRRDRPYDTEEHGDRRPLGPGIQPSIAKTTTSPFTGKAIMKASQTAYPATSNKNVPFAFRPLPSTYVKWPMVTVN